MRQFKKFGTIDENIAKKLREFRISAGISQEKLGQLCGLSFQQIQKYEAMQNRINASKLFEIAQALNKPISAFFENVAAHKIHEEKSQEEMLQDHKEINKEILPLIRAFNMIENKQLRKKLVSLAQEIAGPFYQKRSKHEYN